MSTPDPDFIIGGAPRSGTGWMLSCLQEHPEAHVPPNELNYFSYEYDRPEDWYREHFMDREPEQRSGEKSPSYLAHPEVPARIRDWNPDVDLIFSLRSPVERAYAMYCMLLQNPHYDVGEDIGDELTPEASIVQTGRYFEHLQRFRACFSDDQIHVLLFDDLKADARTFAVDLFRTVGVDASFEPSLLNQRYGHRKKRGGPVWGAIQELSIRMSRIGGIVRKAIQWMRRKGYTDWIHWLRPGKEYPKLPRSVRDQLNQYYRSDVKQLSDYLDRDLQHWIERE
jgi:hypothetical protein